MALYPYRMQLVVDPDNPRNVVAAGSVSIYDSEDTAHTTLLTLTDPSGVPIPNPITSNANGFTPPFVTTSPEVLWVSGPYTDYFQSYKGMRDEAVAAKEAAESAAATAGAEAAVVATAAIGTATDAADAAAAAAATAASNASASATAAANAAALVAAPADTAVAALINASGSAARGALNATFVPRWAANTAYASGAKVVSPAGDTVTAKTAFTSGATYNAANWDLSANLSGKLDKTEAQANYAQLSTLAATFRPATTRQQQPAESIVTTFSSGHTWATSGTGVTWDLNYTGDAFAGSQCVRGTTLGTNVEGSVQSISRTPTIDLTNKVLVMPVKIVSGLANLVSIRVLLSDNNFTANSSVLVFDGNSSTQVIREGEWFNLRFTIADITSSTGTPNLAAVNAIRIAIRDKGAGGVAVVEIGKFSYYTPPSATQFPNGAVTLWFDDSYPSHRTIAAPHMAKYGFAGSEAVICDKIDGANGMTMTQLKELASMYGWEINPHSYTVASHTAGYPSLTEQQLVDEINSIKAWMASHGFGANDHFAYPLGQHSALTDEVLGRYFSTARTTKQLPLETMLAGTRMRTRCVATDNTTTLAAMQAIIDRAFRPGVWLQIYIHDIVADGTANTTTKMETTTFKGIIDYLNTKGCRVMTAGDVWNAGL